MVAGTLQVRDERFVIVPKAEYDRMRELAREFAEGDGPALPKPDAHGNAPAVEYARVSLARKLIRDRRRAGLTQAELAQRAKIRTDTLNKIEQGHVTPDSETFKKIHRALQKAERQTTENIR